MPETRTVPTNPNDLIQAVRNLPSTEGAELVALCRASRAAKPSVWDDYWYQPVGQGTIAGTKVDERSALKFGPVYAAVRRISENIASLPLNLLKITGRKKEKAVNDPLFRLLHLQPNPEMTAIQYREALQSHLLLWGNHYSHIVQDLLGKPLALWPLDPSRMVVKRPAPQGMLVYEYKMTDSGEVINLPPWEVLHIAGLGFNGLMGYSVINLMREAVGLGLAQEEFSSRFYSNGASPNGILELGGDLKDDERAALQKWWEETYGGASAAHKTIIAAQGLKFHPLTVPQKDAEYLETRNFSVREIARWFCIPPHMIGDLSDAKWANIEQQALEFVMYTLRPWIVRIEQAMEVKFNLGPQYEIRHIVEGLLRGDTQSRAAFYKEGIMDGWLTRNEVRELEDRNPAPGLDEFLVPQSNAAPLSEKGNGEEKKAKEETLRMMVDVLSTQDFKSLAERMREKWLK